MPEFNPLRDWPGSCKPTSIVRLDERSLGLRLQCAQRGQMTMPLRPATFRMLVAPFFFRPR